MQKKKGGVKKCLEIMTIKGEGVRRLMDKTILNFHFDYLHTSLNQNQAKTMSVKEENNAEMP